MVSGYEEKLHWKNESEIVSGDLVIKDTDGGEGLSRNKVIPYNLTTPSKPRVAASRLKRETPSNKIQPLTSFMKEDNTNKKQNVSLHPKSIPKHQVQHHKVQKVQTRVAAPKFLSCEGKNFLVNQTFYNI